jgi:hypothetical protein
MEQQGHAQGKVGYGLGRAVLSLLRQAQQLFRDFEGGQLAGPMQVMLK